MPIDRTEIKTLAEALLKEGRLEEAILAFGQLLVDKPMDLITRNKVADLCFEAGRVNRSVLYLHFLADYYEWEGFLPHALAILRKALRQRPFDPETSHRIAALQAEMGRVREAISIHLDLGDRYLRCGQPGRAGLEYRLAERWVARLGP